MSKAKQGRTKAPKAGPGVLGAAVAATAMGRGIAATDWSAHPLGEPAAWPVSLTSLLAMMAACPTPMFLAWGEDLSVFFNDAYRPIWGSMLRDGLTGARFRDVWGHVWDDIGPLVDRALRGDPVTMADMKLDLRREGVLEESWWTFTYSPVFDEGGRVAGMICVTGETTAAVMATRAQEAADERLQLALSAGDSVGTWDWDVVADRITSDARFALLYGVDPEAARAGAPIAEFFTGIHPDDREPLQGRIQAAMRDGGAFAAQYRLVGRDGKVRWVSAQGRCILDDAGRCVRLPGVSFDITARVEADLAVRAAKEERDFVIQLTARQRELGSPEAVIRLSVEAIGRRLGVDRCGFHRALPNDRVRAGPCWTAGAMPPLVGDYGRGAFGPRVEACWTRGQPLTYADTRDDAVGGLDALRDMGVTSGACVPLMRDGRHQAGIFAHCREVRAWTASEISLLREVAELTLLAVDRAEAVLRLEGRVGQQEYELTRQAGELRDEATGRSAAEGQVRQLQKMEAVGQLTGGIAHDFNNMLAVVIGGLDLLQRRLARGDTDVAKYIDAAMDGATRAAALTQRLLAFSRQSPLDPEPLDVNALVQGLSGLLARTLGERVRLEIVTGAGLWRIKADAGELENVIVNLSVNARDAMPDGGRLTIETGNAHLDEAYAADEDLKPGQYVLLAITDTGAGMPPDVIARAFDPFFTTKGVGKGTGLGLSQVFGFVRQSGGHVKIYSEEGHGTTVKVYMPRLFGDAPTVARKRASTKAVGGNLDEVVLVVEDEGRLRNFTTEALRDLGYTVVHAGDGAEALAMIQAGQGATLLFTDVVMPGITGRQLADEAARLIPGLKVLYTTGYTRNAVVHNGTLDPGTFLLPKPFGLDALAKKVREVLDG